jgi:[acyl-carrier-protein] S-malonyltransferase
MNSNMAYVFPGQGSQYAGMGKDLFDNFEVSREVFLEADQALGFPLTAMCFEGDEGDLQLTENTQPAILTVSVAALRAMSAVGISVPRRTAGHSLGEYSALVASGAISLADAVRTVRSRGRYMQEATPVGTGAMAAILGSDLSTVERACNEAAEGEVCSPANINSPGQIVIAGNSDAVDRALMIVKELGAKRAIKLNVSAPFHCALMLPAQKRLEADLNQLEFSDLLIPIVTNVDAGEVILGSEARDALVRQVSSPVRWLESVEKLISSGVDTFIEVGPGKVLSGLIRQINRGVRCLNVEDSATLKLALEFSEQA